MNISKKIIGWSFILSGFVGGMLLGYMQITKNSLTLHYSFVYIALLASWYMLFDYTKRLE